MYKVLFFLVTFTSLFGQNDLKKIVSNQTLTLSQGNNAFAFDLYLNLDQDKNLFFSPYNISLALSMVYDGARNDTRKEMEKVLHFDQSLLTLNESFSMLNRIFETPTIPVDGFNLNIVSSLWIQSGVQILPQFLDDMARYFKATPRRADFQKHPDAARREINYFVKDKTMGKIEELVGASDIDSSTKMMIISTIYMKARWKNVFDSKNTEITPFFIGEDNKISVDMMNQKTFFAYYQTTDFAAIELPYIHLNENYPDLNLVIILPHENFGLSKIEKTMNAANFKQILDGFENEEINLFLPKFRFTKSLSLKEILTEMGMGKAFSSEANFEGINGKKDLKIGQVLHKAFISVNETGTEAAAATSVSMNLTSFLPKKEPILFKADHPFMFIIYEKSSSQILFLGRISNPS